MSEKKQTLTLFFRLDLRESGLLSRDSTISDVVQFYQEFKTKVVVINLTKLHNLIITTPPPRPRTLTPTPPPRSLNFYYSKSNFQAERHVLLSQKRVRFTGNEVQYVMWRHFPPDVIISLALKEYSTLRIGVFFKSEYHESRNSCRNR